MHVNQLVDYFARIKFNAVITQTKFFVIWNDKKIIN
jgi:hypothetical protein